MALGVLSEVKEESADGSWQLAAADAAEVRVGGGISGANEGFGVIEGLPDGGEEFGKGGGGVHFVAEGGELGLGELFTAEVGGEAVEAAGDVAELEPGGGEAGGGGPEGGVVEAGGPVEDFVTDLHEGVADAGAEGVEVGQCAAEPRFHDVSLRDT